MVRPVRCPASVLRARNPLAPLAAACATLVLLAGCSVDAGARAEASDAPSAVASESATVTPSAGTDDSLDANQACAEMYVDGDKTLEERIGTALVGASDGLDAASADQMHAISVELGRLEPRVPQEFREPVEQVRVPFLQLQKALDLQSAQEVELDVASTVAGLKAYQGLC